MNFIDSAGISRFSDDLTQRMASYTNTNAGKRIQIGVRPEQLFVMNEASEYDLMLDAEVLAVEDLGADCLIYIELNSDKSQLIWRAVAGTEVEIGEKIQLAAKSESLHLFDSETGERIEI